MEETPNLPATIEHAEEKPQLPDHLQKFVEQVGRPVTSRQIDNYARLQELEDRRKFLTTIIEAWEKQQTQDRDLRKKYADWLMYGMGAQIVVINVVFVLLGFKVLTVNHEISKRIVATAKTLGVGIALEDLEGIRARVEPTVGKRFRRRFGNWSFCQLRLFVEYKARREGVPVATVDPRNSSRTCSACGHCEQANRPDQATFRCKHCGHSEHADVNAARNIRAWAARNAASKLAG